MTDDVYAWRDLRFTLSPGLEDDTLLAFRGAGWSLTIARDALAGATLEAYAKTQERALVAQRLAAYVADGPAPFDAGSAKGVMVDRRFTDATGTKLFQRQCFLALGSVVAIVTASAREAAADKAKQGALQIVQTIHLAGR